MKDAPPGQRTRCREEEVILAVATNNDRILYYQKVASSKKFDFPLVRHSTFSLKFCKDHP